MTLVRRLKPNSEVKLCGGFPAVAAGVPPAVEPGLPARRKEPDVVRRCWKVCELAGKTSAVPGGRMPPSTAGGTPAATTAAASVGLKPQINALQIMRFREGGRVIRRMGGSS